MADREARLPKVGDKVVISSRRGYVEGEVLAVVTDYMGRVEMAQVGFHTPFLGWGTTRWVESHHLYYK